MASASPQASVVYLPILYLLITEAEKSPTIQGWKHEKNCTHLKYAILGHKQVRLAVIKECHLTKERKTCMFWPKMKANLPPHPYLDLGIKAGKKKGLNHPDIQ